ncbi:hypothetical protein ACJ73_08100 [Blastomyces percursus]|uniref:Uncharacterized protein n=1 Tax=Blastomyces percursus TaxID=1658174 RepID=A0A1J9QZ33_9EURO|nr:hypothetical protein ACJ73_08100 [Blastomyces percursus]
MRRRSGRRAGHIFHAKCHYFEDSKARVWKQHILHKSHNFPGSLGQTTYFIPKTTTLGTPQGKRQTYIIPQAMTLPTDTPGRTTCFAVRATTFWAPQGKALKQHISKQSPQFSGSPGATAFSDQKPQLSQLPRAKVQKKHISAENHDVLKFRRTDHGVSSQGKDTLRAFQSLRHLLPQNPECTGAGHNLSIKGGLSSGRS